MVNATLDGGSEAAPAKKTLKELVLDDFKDGQLLSKEATELPITIDCIKESSNPESIVNYHYVLANTGGDTNSKVAYNLSTYNGNGVNMSNSTSSYVFDANGNVVRLSVGPDDIGMPVEPRCTLVVPNDGILNIDYPETGLKRTEPGELGHFYKDTLRQIDSCIIDGKPVAAIPTSTDRKAGTAVVQLFEEARHNWGKWSISLADGGMTALSKLKTAIRIGLG